MTMSRGDYSDSGGRRRDDDDDRGRRRDDDYDPPRRDDYDDRDRGRRRDYDDYDRRRRDMPFIDNYLVFSILVTVFCCWPLGIVAIVYAASVNSYLGSGDIRGAREASNNAKMWCWISFWLGLVPLLIAGIWLVFAAVMVSTY
jgi:hypothetical protein